MEAAVAASPFIRLTPKFVWYCAMATSVKTHKIYSFIACRRTGMQSMIKIPIRICSPILYYLSTFMESWDRQKWYFSYKGLLGIFLLKCPGVLGVAPEINSGSHSQESIIILRIIIHWWRDLFMCNTVHIRSYIIKSHWKVQGRNFTPE